MYSNDHVKVVVHGFTRAFVNMGDWKELSSVYTYIVNKT